MIVEDGAVVGAVCTATCGGILRLKNLVVDPDHRRRGVATATASHFARLAAEAGHTAAGCFALDGEPSVVAYSNAGYHAVTQQTEWVRNLEGVSR